MWAEGDDVVIVEPGKPDVPCVVDHVHRDGSCVAGGRRWKRDGWEYGRYTGAAIERAERRQSTLAYRERVAVLDRINAQLRRLGRLGTDELRAVLAWLEAR